MNLASQSVLEGLNAVLDHRGSAYIPELDKTFYISKQTRLFGCQNPLKEGGNRRGLPKSFLNRFTQVRASKSFYKVNFKYKTLCLCHSNLYYFKALYVFFPFQY